MRARICYLQPQSTVAFVSTWKTNNPGTSSSTQITIPTVSDGLYNCQIFWGDGTNNQISVYNDAALTHTYPAEGDYIVRIVGVFTGLRFNGGGDKQKLLNISQWGSLKFTNVSGIFSGCTNMTITARDRPDISNMTTFQNFFLNCSSITTVPSLNSWQTGNITNMNSMFSGCSLFNQSLDAWNTAAVTNMNGMFNTATLFNGTISSWNTSSVTTMANMFIGTNFNRPIGSWNVSSVTNMSNMFQACTLFNQNIGSWNVANVTDMGQMFQGCVLFNQNISSWNTGNNTTMISMFRNCSVFNQNIGGWNTSKVTSLNSCFLTASNFNQDISGWDVSKVTNAASCFNGATSFNQNIGAWNTIKITNMNSMFQGASVFDQDLGGWNVTALTTATSMFTSSGLTKTNYNPLLIGWSAQAVNNGVVFSGGSAHYDGAAVAARAVLTGTYSWTITDGGTP